jgi:ribonuclease P/MRP protein subunit RPP1
MFYDLHVRAEPEKAAEMAGRLGLSGIGLTVPLANRAVLKELHKILQAAKDGRRQETPSVKGVDVALGLEIHGKPSQIQSLAKSVRGECELIVVKGGTEEANRAALEAPEVDMLVGHALENGACGMNHILARLGAKNNVAVCFDLWEIVQAYKKTRSNLLTAMMETARFVRKYKCPFVLSSGAMSEWDMRGASELIAFGKFLGFQEDQCRKALSGSILAENRKRLSGKWVMPGVEVE